MQKAYKFDVRIHLPSSASRELRKRDDVEKNNPFLKPVSELSSSSDFPKLRARVSKRCTTNGRGCITAYGVDGDVIATSIADALKKIRANFRNSELDYLQLLELRDIVHTAGGRTFTILGTVREYEWDDGLLRRDNYVAQKFKRISGDTKLYTLFEQALRK